MLLKHELQHLSMILGTKTLKELKKKSNSLLSTNFDQGKRIRGGVLFDEIIMEIE